MKSNAPATSNRQNVGMKVHLGQNALPILTRFSSGKRQPKVEDLDNRLSYQDLVPSILDLSQLETSALAGELSSLRETALNPATQDWRKHSQALALQALQAGLLVGAGQAALHFGLGQTLEEAELEQLQDSSRSLAGGQRSEQARDLVEQSRKRWFFGGFKSDLQELFELGHQSGVDMALSQIPKAELLKKAWTVLVYNNASDNDSRFEYDMQSTLKGMVGAAPENFYLVVQHSQASQNGTAFRSRLSSQGPVLDRSILGPTDMGSVKTYRDFLEWGMSEYPAEQYAVVFQGHGGGPSGLSPDDVHQSHISVPDFAQAVREAPKPVQVLAFDSCAMSCLSVAAELAGGVQYMVGSQELVKLNRLDYGKAFAQLSEQTSPTAKDLASALTRNYRAPAVALFDLQQSESLWESMSDLSAALLKSEIPVSRLRQTVRQAQRAGSPEALSGVGRRFPEFEELRDLGDLCRRLISLGDESLAKAARETIAALRKSRSEGYIHDQESQKGSNGMSVYLPLDNTKFLKPMERTRFARDTGWDLVARKMSGTLQEVGLYLSDKGAVVTKLEADSPAESSGFEVDDRIVALGERQVHDRLSYRKAFRELPLGQGFEVTVERAGERVKLTVQPRPLVSEERQVLYSSLMGR